MCSCVCYLWWYNWVHSERDRNVKRELGELLLWCENQDTFYLVIFKFSRPLHKNVQKNERATIYQSHCTKYRDVVRKLYYTKQEIYGKKTEAISGAHFNACSFIIERKYGTLHATDNNSHVATWQYILPLVLATLFCIGYFTITQTILIAYISAKLHVHLNIYHSYWNCFG